MLARMLQISGVVVTLAALALAGGLAWLGVPVWLALLAGALLPLAIHGVPLAVEFVTGALTDRRPIARIGPFTLLRVWWGETWRSFMVFNVDQPWRADFAESPLVPDAQRPAVLFIHGYMCNRAVWRPWLLKGDVPQRWNCATVNLEPPYGSVDDYADGIAQAVAQLRAATGAARVTLVCHSMGGLAARAYLRSRGHDAVARVVTIDTPHHGTLFARLGKGANARQMRRACDYVTNLARSAEPVEFVCFASQHDNLIVPRDAQVLACTEAIWFERIGHLAMTGSDAVLRRLIEIVERPLPRDAENDGAGEIVAAAATAAG